MQKGYVYPETIQKEQAKAVMRDLILAELRPIVRAGIRAATGVDHFMLRNEETGEFRRLTDPAEIEAALNHPGAKEGSTFWIHSKDPNIPALVTLLDRAIGKPVEEVQMEITSNEPLAQRMKKARERLASRR